MKLFLAVALLMIGAHAASAQSDSPGKATCSLASADVSDISGLRLGMTAEQVLALFPGSSEDQVLSSQSKSASPLGVSSFTITPSRYKTKENFAGVSQITFTFLDGRVSTFSIGYNGTEWPHVDKFVAKVIEGTNLPPADAWAAYPGMDTQLKYLTCVDFEARVFAGGQGGINYILFNDLVAARTLKERRDKAREKEKQGSKP